MTDIEVKHTSNAPLGDAFIIIRYRNDQFTLNRTAYQLITILMREMNGALSANSPINYHYRRVTDLTIEIPIYIYANDEKTTDPEQLIRRKFNIVEQFFKRYDWNNVSTALLWTIRSLNIIGLDILASFTISTRVNDQLFQNIIDQPLIMKYPKLTMPIIHRERLADDSTITYISDPYMKDYGQYLNLTKSYNDMGMAYNVLHLYEHVMTCGWDEIETDPNIIVLNGRTYPHGLCYVYTVHKTDEAMKKYAAASLSWFIRSREHGFWNDEKHRKQLMQETTRTISETRTLRSMVNFGRSDPTAYDYAYNTAIFEFWSNQPFDLLIAGPGTLDELRLRHENINSEIEKRMPRKVERPKNPTFGTIPLEPLKMKSVMKMHIIRLPKNLVKRFMMKYDSKVSVAFGVDCAFKCRNESSADMNTVLLPLLLMNRLLSDDELKEWTKRNIIPFSTRMLQSSPLSLQMNNEMVMEMVKASADESENEALEMELERFDVKRDDVKVETKKPRKRKDKGKRKGMVRSASSDGEENEMKRVREGDENESESVEESGNDEMTGHTLESLLKYITTVRSG